MGARDTAEKVLWPSCQVPLFSLIPTKLIACAGNMRGVSGMTFHEDPYNLKQDRAEYFGFHAKCPYFFDCNYAQSMCTECAWVIRYELS
jgi:hypothetical protein